MEYSKELIAAKLRRWEKYLESYCLPEWNDIPDLGLYMEQVIALLRQYLDYLPPELKEEQFITAATINNYVRMKVMPSPDKKRYYRTHIAYLLIICSLKQGMSLSLIQKIIPVGLSDEELKETYVAFADQHNNAAKYFIEQVRRAAGKILDHEDAPASAVSNTSQLVVKAALVGNFSRLLSEKLLLLEGKSLEEGGDISIDKE